MQQLIDLLNNLNHNNKINEYSKPIKLLENFKSVKNKTKNSKQVLNQLRHKK
jgi:hypothetical protein